MSGTRQWSDDERRLAEDIQQVALDVGELRQRIDVDDMIDDMITEGDLPGLLRAAELALDLANDLAAGWLA